MATNGAQRELVRVSLEGQYTPSDFYDEPVSLERPDFAVKIDNGQIEVNFKELEPLPDPARQAAVNREVDLIFTARVILSGRCPEVSVLTMKCYYSDGTRDIYEIATTTIRLGTSRPIDIIVTDNQGAIIRDSKAERLADEDDFRSQCLRHANDAIVNLLLKSFRQAIADPADMMTHLYEIRDALGRHFKSDKEAKKALGLSNADWSDFGRITNNEPILESRHRGSHEELRPATEQEQTKARDLARRMLRSYLTHLDQRAT